MLTHSLYNQFNILLAYLWNNNVSFAIGNLGKSNTSSRIPVGRSRFFALNQTGSGTHPASCTMDTGSFPGVKSGRGVTLTPHPLLVPWSWKGRAVPLLPLLAVGLCRTSVPVHECTLPYFYMHPAPWSLYKQETNHLQIFTIYTYQM
jgi:hypothetical protein